MDIQRTKIMPIMGVLLIASYGFGATLARSISDTVGTTADCPSTVSIASGAIGSATINFTNQLITNNFDDTYISIEQTA